MPTGGQRKSTVRHSRRSRHRKSLHSIQATLIKLIEVAGLATILGLTIAFGLSKIFAVVAALFSGH